MAAFGYAITMITTKKLTATQSTFSIIFWMAVIQFPLSLLGSDVTVFANGALYDLRHILPAIGVGVAGLTSHYCLSNAFRAGDATLVVPLDFMRIPLIAVVGWAFYGERLDIFVLIGALIIIAGVLWNLRAEHSARALRPSPRHIFRIRVSGMKRHTILFAILLAAALAPVAPLAAQAQQGSPTCQRLEAQLASLDRGNNDPARADRIKRAEDAVNRQQFQVDQLVAQGRRAGCESSGFFSIFSNPPPQCGALNRQIGQQRNTLERMQNDLEQVQGGTAQRAAQRQSLLIALGDNGCGSQYRNAALQGQQGGFFDRLFGGNGGLSSAAERTDGQHLPHHLRAHLRRLLLPDLVCDHAGSFPRRRADLPAHLPGGGSFALHLS